MIASVRGVLAAKGKGQIVVETGGLGLRLLVPAHLLDQLDPGQEVSLVTHLHMRENEWTLYGFATVEELELFELLMTVPGVGPRVALNLMSNLPPEALRQAIAQGDLDSLSRVPGIGRKIAQRLVLDLRDKIGATTGVAAPFLGLTAAEAEVISGLTSLGYSVMEAEEAVRALPDTKLSLEEKLRLALSYLGSKS